MNGTNLSSAARAVLLVVAALDHAQVDHLVVNVGRPGIEVGTGIQSKLGGKLYS